MGVVIVVRPNGYGPQSVYWIDEYHTKRIPSTSLPYYELFNAGIRYGNLYDFRVLGIVT